MILPNKQCPHTALQGVSKKREVTLNSKIIVLNDVTHEKTLL